MIIRLHAMYQRSKIMLVFLCVIFLAIQIACVIILAIQDRESSAGELHHRFQSYVYQAYQTHTSGVCLVRRSYVQLPGLGHRPAFGTDNLDIGYCMGDPRIVSCSLDWYKTLP
jgi:hypothetical protein